MATDVLFVQGAGEGTHDNWDNKLAESLRQELGAAYQVHYPRMPDEDDPKYAAWKAALLSAFDSLDDGAILVGHSVGATILLHVLAESALPRVFGGLFLIAPPFIGEGGWPDDDIAASDDLADRLPPGIPIYLYRGTADDVVPAAHVDLYMKALPHAVICTLEGRDHQLNNNMREIARDIRAVSRRSEEPTGG
ncbi:alpha/beta fold hydrolase [Phyllobacterium sp. SYP-B3895]|uniref:alpha/beta fold hydrolase n=1 Tax=Phyllobacterium sp. SYP-B3895 TaxID=2663240 RepID=UPI0012996606|nr:alpha/beta fold hydrolase [Phyllobacterium sp. SYP-B3895]MRG56567.1 alpha/beta fold hydrolase [Phyllobacterium sp. SYP-B3895]